MSVDINWETITSGPDGEALAETIRAFVHERFQQIALPRFINSVHIHSFDFGKVCPEIEIKDVCEPFQDFYEDDESDFDDAEKSDEPTPDQDKQPTGRVDQAHLRQLQEQILHAQSSSKRSSASHVASQTNNRPILDSKMTQSSLVDLLGGQFPRAGTSGVPGGTSNLSYFHLPMSGLSGTQTPLAAVASGAPFPPAGWHHDLLGQPLHHSNLREPSADANDATTRPSTASSITSPPDLGTPFSPHSYGPAVKVSDDPSGEPKSSSPPPRLQPPQPSDLQVVARVKYAGDVRMTLTAEILLDYPMPSFVGIPLKLSITGMTFDGVAIVAYITNKDHKRICFCFLSPGDADAMVGDQIAETDEERRSSVDGGKGHMTGLLQEIQVESEIGRKGEGRQVLKNVGKVEKFVLEQVRRIFEEEFVFPSFWTFLV